MPKALRFRSALCVAVIGVLILTPTAASAQALQSYVKIKGAKQGNFKGDKRGSSSATVTSDVAIKKPVSGSSRRR
jgi:hypothetical protein